MLYALATSFQEEPHWIWNGFPEAYVGAELVDQVGGWLLAGLAMAKIVRPIVVGHSDQTG